MLDDYLERTDIVSPEKLSLDLRRATILGLPIVEVRPVPEGSPENFVDAFDRYNTVRNRYDVTQPSGGLVHVMPSPDVVDALRTIKSMPGRRLASDEARLFGHNPFAVLGDRARDVLDEEELIRSRQNANLLPYRLTFVEGGERSALIRLAPLSDTLEAVESEVAAQAAQQLLGRAGTSRARGLPIFCWEGWEIELNPVTESALVDLANWLGRNALADRKITLAEVMNLEAYSDRVVGFDAKVQTVPYIAKRDKDGGWVPDNIEAGLVAVDLTTGAVHSVAMSPANVAVLQERVAAAKAEGANEVTLPDSNIRLPVQQAEHLVKTFKDAEISVGRKKAPTPKKDPKNEGKRASLQILHNIEKLDYQKPVAGGVDGTNRGHQLPRALRAEVCLLPHQEQGLAWLQRRYEMQKDGLSGCLLADDMGLGKTMQALCLIAWHVERVPLAKPSLVIAPVSLLENWKLEIRKFLGWADDDVLSLYGSALSAARTASSALDDDLANAGVRKLLQAGFEGGYKIVLTTYETLRDYEFSLARVAWGVVVCDEAQKIKNPAAFVTQAAKALRADFRVACTGTPVENSLADLWCLFDFFQPGHLGALNEFSKKFRRDIETRAEGHQALIEHLRSETRPWVLRRMKTEVHGGLPKKVEGHDADPECDSLAMSSAQSALYSEVVAQYRAARSANRSNCTQILELLAKLRKICASPLSVIREDHEFRPVAEHMKVSPKLSWLVKRLEAIRQQGEKAIVFTEFREIQRLIQRAVAEHFAVGAQIINGSTSVDPHNDVSRQRLIDSFQAKPGFGVIILSTTAVGFGVNIQAANHVIHFTRPWNPAKEDQATDRAYRIGQTKDVFVYCPTVVGSGYESFEQRLAALLRSKRDLSRDMLSGTQEVKAEDFVDL